MKQALHIFLKDVRHLWIQIALLMVAIGYFAWQDIHLPGVVNGSGALVIECIAGGMVWFLIARAVHEESLPGENQFWLTRPYRRASLLGAKLAMVLIAVIVPFFVADCVILGAQSLPVAGNLGGLILRQFVTAAWLVLPPFAIASVTRSITEDVMVWIVALAVAGLFYFPIQSPTFEASAKQYWLVAAVLLMIGVLWQQYLRRGVVVSRTLMAAAVLLPAQPFPHSAAAGIEQMGNDSAASAISISVKSVSAENMALDSSVECALARVGLNGIRPDWRVSVLAEKDTFTAENGKSETIGWRPGGMAWSGVGLQLCAPAKQVKDLGMGKKLAIHTSVILGVFRNESPVDVRATYEPVTLPGIGRCQFETYYRDDYHMRCKSPVWAPLRGEILITGEMARSSVSMVEYAVTPMGMLPGMSPVYQWVTLSSDAQIRRAVAAGDSLEFQPEKRIAVLEREIDVKDVEF